MGKVQTNRGREREKWDEKRKNKPKKPHKITKIKKKKLERLKTKPIKSVLGD